MTGATIVPPDVEAYLAAVREELADVPAAERDDLLAEVEASLAEAAEESGRPLAATLGSPHDFAAELRNAAGLHATPATARAPSELGRRVRLVAGRIAGHPRVAALRRLASELAPIWWVARAYLAVGLVAVAVDAGWSARYAVVPRLGSAEFGLAAIAAAVVVSVWLGTRARRRGSRVPRVALGANLALAAAAIPVALAVADTRAYDALVASAYSPARVVAQPQPGLVYEGRPVANVYPYSRDGRLLHDVLLYDGAGRPLEIESSSELDTNRRGVRTTGGRPLYHVFPIRYFEPGTRRVARPSAGPPIELPVVRTPPLRPRGK
ncbi:MAG: hypothetical protein ICV64_00715 [Thermoleophilia bacterium]|nr:hypothetical protein [Thermoleophilia bacterium]